MNRPVCEGELFGHNFPYAGAKCLQCGVLQGDLNRSGKPSAKPKESVGDLLSGRLQKAVAQEPPKGIHSELHLLVSEMRRAFGETAKKGKGSFGFYLGCLKRMGYETAREIFQEIQKGEGRDKKRLFWWKYGQIMKQRKTSKK